MNEPQENKHIDDLFARKLGNMSLPPSPDGFERLQARMGHTKPETKMVFWRNPDMQRYMAIAACLLLVCLFGWLYQSSPDGTNGTVNGTQVADKTNKKVTSPVAKETGSVENQVSTPIQESPENQLAATGKPDGRTNGQTPPRIYAEPAATQKGRLTPAQANEQPVVAQANSVETPAKPVPAPIIEAPAVNSQTAPQQIAENTAKPAPVAERGLIVTIEEPAALIAARRAAKTIAEDEATVASATPVEKEAKSGGLWQQMKKLKQGEVFARSDKPANDERGLLSRAFAGLKNNFDKDDKVRNDE